MIDSKSKLILNILSKSCKNGNYQVVELCDILSALPRRLKLSGDAVRHVLTFLERQDLISIKYEDETKFCLALLPYAYEILENDQQHFLTKENRVNFSTVLLSSICAFISTLFAILICFFLIKFI